MGPYLAAGRPDPYLGRDDLHGRLVGLAAAGLAGGCPRVQLTHSVGNGGTAAALAFAWSDELSGESRFTDGWMYLTATDPQTGAPVPASELQAAVLVRLGYPDADIPTSPQRIDALYRRVTHDKRMLVVLDDANGVTNVAPLVPHSMRSMVIVIAHRRLPLPGFLVVEVPPLSNEPSRALLACLLERAGGDVAGLDERTVAELLDVCAGNPAIIHIVAGAVGQDLTYTPRLVADVRARGVEAFRGEGGEGLIRALDLAYDGLTEAGQRAYRLLALLPGREFTAPAAARVLGVDVEAAERAVHGLVRYNMVRATVQRGAGRYRWHRQVLAHAYAMAARVEPAEVRDRARRDGIAWYRRMALTELLHATDRWQAPAERWRAEGIVRTGPVTASRRSEAVDVLRAERETLEAAVRRSLDAGMFEAAADLCLALWVPHHRDGPRAATLDLYPPVIDAARASNDGATVMQLELEYAAILLAAGELPTARHRLEDALRLADELGHGQGRQSALEWLGKVARALGQPDEAVRLFAVSADVPVPQEQRARTHALLALQTTRALYDLGRYDEAVGAARSAVAFFATTTDTDNIAKSAYELGRALLATGAAAEAATVLRRAARGFEAGDSIGAAAAAWSTLAFAHRVLGERTAEDAALAAARPLYERLFAEDDVVRVDARRAELAAAAPDAGAHPGQDGGEDPPVRSGQSRDGDGDRPTGEGE